MQTLSGVLSVVMLVPAALVAQGTDAVLLTSWPAPLYWQPSPAETEATTFKPGRALPRAQAPVNSLVFVGMTPCRVVDTRSTQAFTGAFGPPSLVGGVFPARTFPIQLSTTCTIPAIAQAYSFNVAVVPQGVFHYLTMYPTGHSIPLASTLNDPLGVVMANAAVVPAGDSFLTNGGIDVFVTNNCDVVIDINGYYAPQSGITLAQGSAGAPSLSFAGDAGTGIYSSGAQTLNFAVGGGTALTLRSDGDVEMGNVRKNGTLFLHNRGTNNTGVGLGALAVTTGGGNTASGDSALASNTTGLLNTASGLIALAGNTTGDHNTASGYNALGGNTTGTHNVALGSFAGSNLTTGSYNINVGNSGVAGDDHIIKIGAEQNRAFIAGIRSTTTAVQDAVPVMIDSNAQLGTISSSRRFKEDIQDMGEASCRLLRLRPVTYRYRQPYADGSKPLDYGLIAEEVAEVCPDLVVKGKDGQVETVQYQKLTPMLLNEVQKLNHHTQQQDETIRQLQEQNRQLTTRLAALEALLSSRVPATSAAGQ